MRKTLVALFAAAVLSLTPSMATAATVEGPQPSADDTNPNSGSAITVASDDEILTPFIFLDPYETIQCQNNNTSFIVHRYFDYNLGGSVALTCGSDNTMGWNHIDTRHQAQWQRLLDKCRELGGCVDPFRTWDDIMNFSAAAALEAATQVVHRPSNSTVCYSTPAWISNQDTGEILYDYWAVVVITTDRSGTEDNPNVIITSYYSTTDSTPC